MKAHSRISHVVLETLKKGRGIRAVGRLSMKDGSLFVVAEHIEFKPTPAKERKERAFEEEPS